MVLGKLASYLQKKETRPLSYTIYKINSKWIKDLSVRPETIKLEENLGSNLLDIGLSNIFLDMSLHARDTKAKINYWDLHQNKKLLHIEGNHQQNEKATY